MCRSTSLTDPGNATWSFQANNDRGRIVVHIEGKADEVFGPLTGEAYDTAVAANELRVDKSQSAVPRRIELLTEADLG